MKNSTLIFSVIALSALTVGVAGAQTKPKEDPKTPKTIKCPIMPDHAVNIADATKKKMYADHKGRRYFFCCAGCPGAFKEKPGKYEKMPSIPTPKAPKKKA